MNERMINEWENYLWSDKLKKTNTERCKGKLHGHKIIQARKRLD